MNCVVVGWLVGVLVLNNMDFVLLLIDMYSNGIPVYLMASAMVFSADLLPGRFSHVEISDDKRTFQARNANYP